MINEENKKSLALEARALLLCHGSSCALRGRSGHQGVLGTPSTTVRYDPGNYKWYFPHKISYMKSSVLPSLSIFRQD